MIISKVIPMIGVASTWIQAVAYNDHGKRGILIQLIPGALNLCIVVMKFIPVRIDDNPKTKAPNTAEITFVGTLRL